MFSQREKNEQIHGKENSLELVMILLSYLSPGKSVHCHAHLFRLDLPAVGTQMTCSNLDYPCVVYKCLSLCVENQIVVLLR